MTKVSILSLLFFFLVWPNVCLTLGSDTYKGSPDMGAAPPQTSNQPVQNQLERSVQPEQTPDKTQKPIEKNIERGVGQEIDSGTSKTNGGLREGLEEPPGGDIGKQPKAAPNPPANAPSGQTSTNKEAQKPIDTYIRGY